VQVNLDFSSEADMVQKFRVSLALQPIATALFADSPFTEGKPNGYLSYRSHIWTDTDPDRTGMLDFVFEQGFGYERYVDYLLDVPMYFSYRNGEYIDCSGQSFRDFMAGRLPALPGALPTMTDWGSVRDLAAAALRISADGLRRRAVLNGKGADETGFLDPLIEFTEANETAAERKLALFHGQWKGDIDHVFGEFAY
ncbi:MAG: glutamate--cysteine ligase, partial [Lysobacteraceae bacterium]